MPIDNWWNLCETGALSFLFKKYKPVNKLFGIQMAAMKVLHGMLVDDYINEFGWGHQEDVVKKTMEVGRRLYKKIVLGDPDQDTLIDLAKQKIMQMKSQVSSQEANFYLQKAVIETEIGFSIDATKVSIKQYHAYMQLFDKRMAQKNKK